MRYRRIERRLSMCASVGSRRRHWQRQPLLPLRIAHGAFGVRCASGGAARRLGDIELWTEAAALAAG